MGEIRIDPNKLDALAGNIRAAKEDLQNQFSSINADMTSLQNEGWNSRSGEEIRRRFDRLRAFFDTNYPPAMQEYIDFLTRTANNYREAEAARKRDIEGLREYV